jgi:hypothetical protein
MVADDQHSELLTHRHLGQLILERGSPKNARLEDGNAPTRPGDGVVSAIYVLVMPASAERQRGLQYDTSFLQVADLASLPEKRARP